MKKRILPALLALCMVMSLLPMAFASGNEGDGGGGGGEDEGQKVETLIPCTSVPKGTTPTGTNPHGERECKATGCECVKRTVTTVVTPPEYEEDGTTIKTPGSSDQTTSFAYVAMCKACMASKECNPCTTPDCGKAAPHEDNHGGTACTKDSRCPAKTHDAECQKACKCTVEHGENSAKCLKTVGTKTNKDGVKLCDACANNAKHNPCSVEKCTLPYGHTVRHTVTTCSQDEHCAATEDHNSSCPRACGNEANVGDGKPGLTGCTLSKGHAGNHDNDTCNKKAGCGAYGKHAGPEYEEDGTLKTAACPNYVKCGIGGCILSVGHTDEHDAGEEEFVCLGAAGDKRCAAAEHITGCPAKCTCADDHKQGGFVAANCTGKADCPECAKLNAANSDACDCPACASTAGQPASGAVTDNEGNEVDTTDPKEPTVPEVPVKAEDFTDIDAEDASQEWLVDAVQTMLDNGWMQGVGGSKFDAGTEANTGMVLTVVARMYGEEGIEGANYAELAKAWADDNDLTEGIDLESDTIARKDIILLLWRLAGKSDSTQELEFTDIEGVEGDYLTALKWAVEKGIVMGNGDGTVTPDGVLTRGQLAALVARYADNVK